MRLLAAGLIGFCVSAGPAMAADAKTMDELVKSFEAADHFMGSVLVAEGDKVLLSKGYGYANLEWSVPNTPDSRIRICSITKHFTAVAVLLLEQRRKLRTSDSVRKYVPEAPDTWNAITIHNLVTHTSGIADPQNLPSFDPYALARPAGAPEEAIPKAVKSLPLLFKPGERYEYSNTNYNMLAYIIAKVSGRSYETFIAENIFGPLGMKDSGFDTWQQVLPHRASGYAIADTGLRNASFIDMTNTYGAGAIYSTVGDLHRWWQGLYGGTLLSSSSLKKMTTPEKNGYAYGVIVQELKRGKVYLHAGGMEGFDTLMGYWPNRKVTVVVLANRNSPVGPLAAGLSAMAHGESAPLFAGLQ